MARYRRSPLRTPARMAGAVASALLSAAPRKPIRGSTASAVGQAAAQAAQSVVSRMQKRERAKKRAMRTPQYGYSAGFVSKRRKANPWSRFTKNGIVCTRENGVVVTGVSPSLPVFVGHSTHGAFEQLNLCFWRAMIKNIFFTHGQSFYDIETESPGGSGSVDVEYVLNDINAAPAVLGQPVSGLSFNQIANLLALSWLSILRGANGRVQVTIIEIRYGTSFVLAKNELLNAVVEFMSKSDLKVQNRTVAAGADEDANTTENVANQPLYGKTYSGKGSGLVARIERGIVDQGKSLLASEQTGTIAYQNNTGELWLREVPLPTAFVGQTKAGRLRVEPGAIKTSSLTHTWRIPLNDLWNTVRFSATQTSITKGRVTTRYGKYRVMALEKMICATSTDTVPVLGVEHNLRMGCIIKLRRRTDTQEVIDPQLFASI